MPTQWNWEITRVYELLHCGWFQSVLYKTFPHVFEVGQADFFNWKITDLANFCRLSVWTTTTRVIKLYASVVMACMGVIQNLGISLPNLSSLSWYIYYTLIQMICICIGIHYLYFVQECLGRITHTYPPGNYYFRLQIILMLVGWVGLLIS